MRPFKLLAFIFILACSDDDSNLQGCRFKSVKHSGYHSELSVNYSQNGEVVSFGNREYGFKLIFDNTGKLLQKDYPLFDPYERWFLEYTSGKVSSLKTQYKQEDNWVEGGGLLFSYDKGKLVSIKESNTPYEGVISWTGNDITSIAHYNNEVLECTTSFSYDGAVTNPMRRFSYFYFADGDANFTYYKLPLYFSEHLVTKQESDCFLSRERNFEYTFTEKGLVESMYEPDDYSVNPFVIWEFDYQCD